MNALGIALVVAASLIFGILPTANKMVVLSGMDSRSIIVYMHLTAFMLAILTQVLKKGPLRVERRQFVFLFLLGAVGMGVTSYFLSVSYGLIPVGLATMLHFMYPSIVTLAMVALFGQRMTKLRALAIVCSISGMLLIANINSEIKPLGIILALCSSLTYAFYVLSNDKGPIADVPVSLRLVYITMGSSCVFLALAIPAHAISLPVDVPTGAVLFGILGLGSFTAFYLLTQGVRYIGAGKTSFINMLEPVTSVCVSTAVYKDYPTPVMWLGCILILFSVFLVACSGKSSKINKNCREANRHV